MKNLLVAVGISLLLGFVALAGEAVAGSDEDVAAINKVREMEAATVNSSDPEVVASIYAKDVEYIPPGEPALKGTDAVQQWVAAMVDQFEVDLEYTSAKVKVVGDWAFEQYAGTVTLTPKAGGDSVTENVRGIHVYHRGEDGAWKITHDIWNSDAPAHATE
jgi:uncharacterized protein (TIGR02246 family)